MLAMLYFPGERFPEGDEEDSRCAVLSVASDKFEVRAVCDVSDGDRKGHGEAEFNLDSGEDAAIKLASGTAFLKACEQLTGYTPPWGILTGIRPAKIAADMMASGKTPEETTDYFIKYLRTDSDRARLAVKTALTATPIITPERRRECSLYIAIPFCPTRCAYCSFVSYTTPRLLSMIPDYLDALLEDITYTLETIDSLGLRIASVYIGGGTPTVLDEAQLRRLLAHISERAALADEFTLEAGRPDTITVGKLRSAEEFGVTRLSVNTQTLNDEVLRTIGRAHTADDFLRAYDMAYSCGVRDVNVDLIAGLPGDTEESFRNSLESIEALSPQNITVHAFSVKRSAKFKTDGSDVFDRDGITAGKCLDFAPRSLEKCSYVPYYMYRQKNTVGNLENVGYSVPGHEGLYNIFMMDEIHSVFAVGASAATKLVSADGTKIERMFEPKYPYEYLSRHDDEHRRALRLQTEKFYCEKFEM